MSDELLEAWWTNHRTNLLLLEKISAAGLKCTLSKRGGRDVAREFAHMHDVRVWHLQRRAKDLAVGLEVFASKDSPTRAVLRKRMNASAQRIATFLDEAAAGKANRRAFDKGVPTMLGYFISHEAHHRGRILLTIKECGHNLSNAERMAIWNWGKI